jgi:hypothetical protein
MFTILEELLFLTLGIESICHISFFFFLPQSHQSHLNGQLCIFRGGDGGVPQFAAGPIQ